MVIAMGFDIDPVFVKIRFPKDKISEIPDP